MLSFLLLGIYFLIHVIFPGGTVAKNLPVNVGDLGSNPRSGRSLGVESGNPLQYSCLGNSTDRGAWWATVMVLQMVSHDRAYIHNPRECKFCIELPINE